MTRFSPAAGQLTPAHAVPVAICLLGIWALAAVLFNPGIMGDNIEQLIWSHGRELGYYKHPPMPTWILIASASLAGWHWWLTNLCAFACLALTGWLTYRTAKELAGEQVAQTAVLLWGLQLSTNWRAHHYSHNTPLVLFVAASAWCAIQAVQQRKLVWWVLFGAACGLAMLTKYQAIISLLAISLACLQIGGWRDAQTWRGLIIAVTTGLVVFSPNLYFLITTDFLPWQYASRFLGDAGQAKSDAAMALNFTAQQLRFLGLALLAGIAAWVAFRRAGAADGHTNNQPSHATRCWIIHLAFTPFALTILLGLADVQLQNQWGVQLLQFVFIPLALGLHRITPALTYKRMLIPVLAIHAIALTVNVVQARQNALRGWSGSGDWTYPARALAAAATRDWQAQTNCPLRYVAGPGYEAGVIAAFSGQAPRVFEGSSKLLSPWIDTADLATRGSIVVAHRRDALPANAVLTGSLRVTQAERPRRAAEVFWAVVRPTVACSPQ
jgi:4-amino-4-deoxy-L-arabinose transferase-like glycosyltransferase